MIAGLLRSVLMWQSALALLLTVWLCMTGWRWALWPYWAGVLLGAAVLGTQAHQVGLLSAPGAPRALTVALAVLGGLFRWVVVGALLVVAGQGDGLKTGFALLGCFGYNSIVFVLWLTRQSLWRAPSAQSTG